MKFLKNCFSFIGRVCLSLVFIFSSIREIFDWQSTEEGLVEVLSKIMTKYGNNEMVLAIFPYLLNHVAFLLLVGVCLQLIGGILIFLGIKTRMGALILILFLLPSTFLFHPFWEFTFPEKNLQMTMFLKNISILGGLITLSLYGCNEENPKSKKLKE